MLTRTVCFDFVPSLLLPLAYPSCHQLQPGLLLVSTVPALGPTISVLTQQPKLFRLVCQDDVPAEAGQWLLAAFMAPPPTSPSHGPLSATPMLPTDLRPAARVSVLAPLKERAPWLLGTSIHTAPSVQHALLSTVLCYIFQF